MLKTTFRLSIIALTLTSCATTGSSNNAVGSLTAGPSVIKPSTNKIGIKQTRQIDGTFTSLYKNPFVLNIGTVEVPVSFKGRNQTVGILGPETDYIIDQTTQLQPISPSQPNVFCRITDNSNYIPCLIDSNLDGQFNKSALNYQGHTFQERDLEKSVKYSKGATEVDCNLDIKFWRGLIGKSLITARTDDGTACPKTDVIGNLKPVTFNDDEFPKTYTILGAEILIHSYENKVLTYTIQKPISSGLALNSTVKYNYRKY